MMLRGAIASMEKRLEKKSASRLPGSTSSTVAESTKCLREDLDKVEGRMSRIGRIDPEEDNFLELLGAQNTLGYDEADELLNLGGDSTSTVDRGVARKCLLLTRTPAVLCCHIQRRYFDPFTNRMEKCVQHVDFPEVLDISPYCAYGPRAKTPWAAGLYTSSCHQHTTIPLARDGERMLYQLQSVVEHRGNANGGHYVCYRRDQNRQWFLISDEVVNPVSWHDVRCSQAYLLFYEAM